MRRRWLLVSVVLLPLMARADALDAVGLLLELLVGLALFVLLMAVTTREHLAPL